MEKNCIQDENNIWWNFTPQNSTSRLRVRKCRFWAGWWFFRMIRPNPTSFSSMILTKVILLHTSFMSLIWHTLWVLNEWQWIIYLFTVFYIHNLSRISVFLRECLQVSDWRSVLCDHMAQTLGGGVSEKTTSGIQKWVLIHKCIYTLAIKILW